MRKENFNQLLECLTIKSFDSSNEYEYKMDAGIGSFYSDLEVVNFYDNSWVSFKINASCDYFEFSGDLDNPQDCVKTNEVIEIQIMDIEINEENFKFTKEQEKVFIDKLIDLIEIN